ncbi:hypothetical protein EIP86_010659 [Pleurotus ostreatoroseus]|nr:hypothetical protein EIP86_010659 [Pleurotus ostreatoroseus]
MSDNDREDETRLVALELRIARQDPEGVKLAKVGDWSLGCSAGTVGLCQDINRQSLINSAFMFQVTESSTGDHLLLYVNYSGHLIRQTVTLTDGLSTPRSLPTSNSSTNLPLPNPFKALKGLKSSENLVAESKDDAINRIDLSRTLDLGLIGLKETISYVRFTRHDDVLRGFGCLHLIPASVASLQRICLGEDNLLLFYADGRARLWDIKTREFWRSMSVEKADEMLKQGGWSEWLIGAKNSPSSAFDGISGVFSIPDAASTLTFDLERFLLQIGAGTVPPGARSTEFLHGIASTARRDQIRSVLSTLLTFSLNEEIDRLCREKLHIHPSNVSVGISSHGATTMYIKRDNKGPWLISPDVSASRASAIVSLLQALLHYEDNSNDARTVTVFYTASLAQVVGPSYKAPNLAILAQQWLQAKAPELRNASRLRFEAGIVRLLDEEVVQLVENWQNGLPSLQEETSRDATRSAMSLFICGTVAIEKYTLLQTGCLTDIAKSIALYLHDELSPHRALAIDLCSRGFPVWQQYVDAVEILRALFTLATSTRKEAISTQNVGQQARSAVLQIASSNTPLFMTTLSIDILQPKSMQHRKSVMQLVIFLIHKKPLALYSNLPRLVEAVVKSLDPNSTASRDAVLDSATEILGHMVET